ncbi:MAG: MBL fold metallo-hydrolase [Pseudomonadota bacterium]
MKLTLLGCGTSAGVPRIGNDWGDCDPNEPKNRRSRVSLHIAIETSADETIGLLIDTAPDLRNQCLAHGISDLSHVLWTHDHADHCHGIDDLRPFTYRRKGKPLHGFGRPYTADALQRRFGYIFAGEDGYVTVADMAVIGKTGRDHAVSIFPGVEIAAIDQPHGPVQSTGFRVSQSGKSVGYATDFSAITEEMVQFYKGCDYLITDCLRREPHPTHAHLGMALDLAERAAVGHAVLTHLDKSMDYRSLCAEVGNRAIVGYDGWKAEL